MKNKIKNRFHYAYVMIISIAFQRFIVCAENTASGLFLLPVSTALGVSQGTFMFYQTLEFAVTALVTMLIPKLTSRFKYTTLNKIGLICMTCGLLCMSRAQNVTMFYLAGLLNGLGLVVCNLLLMGTMIPRWFNARIGVMMATVTLLFTLPGMVLSPVVSYLLSLPSVLGMESWRGTYFLLALLPITVGMFNAFFVLKESPAALGLTPCGETHESNTVSEVTPLHPGICKQTVVRSSSCLLLALAIVLWSTMSSINPYLASYISTSHAAAKVSFDLKGFVGAAVAVGSLTGAYLIGIANDRFGARGGVVVGCVCGAAGAAAMLLGSSFWIVLLIGASLVGVYISLFNVQIPIMVKDMYGNLDYDKLFPLFTSIGGWFGAFSVSFWGVLRDTTGSYTAMFSIAVVACSLAGILGSLAIQKSKLLWNDNPSSIE